MTTIALFDHRVTATNPIGGCHLRMLNGLAGERRFTVFAADFENPRPQQIRWVKIPAPRRPLALSFFCYHLLAPVYYLAHRLRHRAGFDLVQIMENCVLFGDIAYVQFCHRTYLKQHWSRAATPGIRGWARWLDHQLRAALEPTVYRRAARVVVPSRGFAAELAAEYPWIVDKLVIISNPVDLSRLQQPADFDRTSFRSGIGLSADDIVLVFVALGQYERKGLPLLMEAAANISDPHLKLLVVGGQPDLVALYEGRAKRMGLAGRAVFVGMQRDVRPYLWAADAFAFPSSYETFSLVCFEAGAAGLPLLVSRLHGVDEVLRDGENGLLLERSRAGVESGIRRFLSFTPEQRKRMGQRARQSVAAYSVPSFVAGWRSFYTEMLTRSAPGP